jgi:hypothetical protein
VLNIFDELKYIKQKVGVQLDLTEAMDLFVGIVPLSLNPVLARNWSKAKKVFMGLIESKSSTLSSYFRENILSSVKASKKPLKVLQEMHRWNALLNLEALKNALAEEKKQVFKIIQGHLDKAKSEFESRTGQSMDPIPGKDSIPNIKNFSPFICGILYGRKLQDKIQRMLNFSE